MVNIVITSDLRLTLQLLAAIDSEYVSDFLLTLLLEINGEDHPDPDDMPDPVRTAYLFWSERRQEIIQV